MTFDEFVVDASCVPFFQMRNVVPARVTAKWTHWFEIVPTDAFRRQPPANHTYMVPPSMLTPMEAGYAPTVKMRGQLEEKLVWYWNHSTVKSPVPTAQSLLAATDTYWLVPLNDMLPPLAARPTPENASTARTRTDAAMARRCFTGRNHNCFRRESTEIHVTPRRSATSRSLASGCTTATRTWRDPPVP
ncbi:MAG: hypothetical protein RLZ48_422 [Actinomycetota bacterium]